jgi:hypothetical protein
MLMNNEMQRGRWKKHGWQDEASKLQLNGEDDVEA